MNPSQNPSALRSKRILTETLLHLMKQYPYHEITVKHIILESGISRKTFYRNFLSKDDILNSYIDTILHQYLEAIKEQVEYSMIQMLDIIFSFCENNQDLLLCGLGVAMVNVIAPVKAKADLVIGSNDEDGIAVFIEENLLSGCD